MYHDELPCTEQFSQPPESAYLPSMGRVLARLGLLEPVEPSGTTSDQLLAALQDPRWETRAWAATGLGKTCTKAFTSYLFLTLEDCTEEVRAASARALGEIKDVTAIPHLIIALLDSQPLVREAAATALGKIASIVSVGPLLVALQDDASEVRAAAVQALGRLQDHSALSWLVRMLHDPEFLVREAAVEALGELGDPQARPFLLTHVQDEDSFVRDAVTHSLLLLEQPITQRFLQLLFQEQEDSLQHLVRSLASTLVDLGLCIHEEKEPIAPLVIALQSMNKGEQKSAMCYLIGRALECLHERIPLDPLLEILQESDQQAAKRIEIWRVIETLTYGALQERKYTRLLITTANDPDPQVRIEIDQALGWLVDLALAIQQERGSTNELQAILEMKDDSRHEPVVHWLLRQALQALDEREAIKPLLEELRRSDGITRAAVAKKLAKQARKALMGRIPGGALNFSLKNASGSTFVELKFGDNQEEADGEPKEDRAFFPWNGPSRNKRAPFPERPRNGSYGSLLNKMCVN